MDLESLNSDRCMILEKAESLCTNGPGADPYVAEELALSARSLSKESPFPEEKKVAKSLGQAAMRLSRTTGKPAKTIWATQIRPALRKLIHLPEFDLPRQRQFMDLSVEELLGDWTPPTDLIAERLTLLERAHRLVTAEPIEIKERARELAESARRVEAITPHYIEDQALRSVASAALRLRLAREDQYPFLLEFHIRSSLRGLLYLPEFDLESLLQECDLPVERLTGEPLSAKPIPGKTAPDPGPPPESYTPEWVEWSIQYVLSRSWMMNSPAGIADLRQTYEAMVAAHTRQMDSQPSQKDSSS